VTPAEFRKVREVFEAAREKRGPERDAALERAGPRGDPIRSRIESLLRDADADDGFLRTAAVPDSTALHLAETALLAEQDLLIGRRVGRYHVRRLLGAGGMGNVYEAQQDQPERLVALKVIHPALAGRASLRRFEYESAVLARLRHPGIAQVFEAGTATIGLGERSVLIPFIAMELLAEAEPVTAFALHRHLPIRERLELLARVCDAVHHGHQRGVIHRDLKPANILVEPTGVPKVIDFGVARAAEGETLSLSWRTGDGQLVGTVAYMSPEQFDTDAREIDIRADVYSLGVVLFETLCGVLPIEVVGRPLAEAARMVREGRSRRLSAVDPSLRGDIETIVEKAMAADRAVRYGSAEQLADDIRRFLRSEPIAARPRSVVYQARLFARRHKALVGAAAAVAVTLTLATAATSSLAVYATRQARAADAARAVADLERARAVRVAEFLQGALGSANPYLPMQLPREIVESGFDHWADWRQTPWPYCGKPGQAATPADIIVAAAARLDEVFADDPESHAIVGTVLGRSIYNLDTGDHGLATLTRAVEAARRAYGNDHEVTIRAMLMLGECVSRWDRQDAEKPRALYRQAVESSRRVFGPFDSRTLEAMRLRAYDMHAFDHTHGDAGDFLMAAVDEARAAGRAGEPAVLRIQSYAGYLYGWGGRWDEAVKNGRDSLDAILRTTGERSPLTAEARDQLSMTLRRRPEGRAEALVLAEQAAGAWAAIFGADSYQALGMQRRTASFYEEDGDWRRAIELLRPLAAKYASLLGHDRYEAFVMRQSLANALYQIDIEPAERLQLAESVMASMRRSRPPDDPDLPLLLWFPRLLAADAAMALGRSEGEADFRALLAETDAGTGFKRPEPLYRAVVRYRLANRLVSAGSLDEAAQLLGEARQILADANALESRQAKKLAEIEARLEEARKE
jgi:hypothetical protein